jgi:hypothetical protein
VDSVSGRITWLYELARAQTDHEEQISAELSTRGGLLAALAGLIVIGLADFWHLHGVSFFLTLACSLLLIGLVVLLFASIGLRYERPSPAKDWGEWASREEQNGKSPQDTDAELVQSLYDDYSACARSGIIANDKKACLLNWASGFLVATLVIFVIAVIRN